MKQYNTQLHVKQTRIDPVYGPTFEGYMRGDALNVFGSLASSNSSMTSEQATAYREAVEARALEFNSSEKISSETGEPVEAFINLIVIREYIVSYKGVETETLKKRYNVLRGKLVFFGTPESDEMLEIESELIKRGEHEFLNYGKQADDWQ